MYKDGHARHTGENACRAPLGVRRRGDRHGNEHPRKSDRRSTRLKRRSRDGAEKENEEGREFCVVSAGADGAHRRFSSVVKHSRSCNS